jgi:hypothetical protein
MLWRADLTLYTRVVEIEWFAAIVSLSLPDLQLMSTVAADVESQSLVPNAQRLEGRGKPRGSVGKRDPDAVGHFPRGKESGKNG